MNRIINYLKGLQLMAQNFRVFDFSVLQGKRVAIVGPADSAFDTGMGSYIDGFDYIVRVNRAPYLVATGKHTLDIGSRTDILFHSFYENDESGGGALDLEMYRKQGLLYLVNPRNCKLGYQNSLVFYRKYGISQPVFTLPKSLHTTICRPFNGHRPTIGFMALLSLVMSDFSELYITGFTFYRTDFGIGYRDHIQRKEDAMVFIKEMGVHNIDVEFQLFKKCFIRYNRIKNIILDEKLNHIVLHENC